MCLLPAATADSLQKPAWGFCAQSYVFHEDARSHFVLYVWRISQLGRVSGHTVLTCPPATAVLQNMIEVIANPTDLMLQRQGRVLKMEYCFTSFSNTKRLDSVQT